MIGFNPTPELKGLLTHHHAKQQSKHHMNQLKTQITRKLTNRHCQTQNIEPISSYRADNHCAVSKHENLKLPCKPKSEK